MPDAIRDCITLLDAKKIQLGYSSVIVDEGQDIGSQSYELIRRIVPNGQNDIFIVGDGYQRIYRNKVVLRQCGIHVIGRSRKLRVNYRTTEETKRLAVSVLNKQYVDDLDNGEDSVQGYVSLMHGDFPEIITLESFEEETKAVIERIRQLEAAGANLKDICIVARTKYIRDAFGTALNNAGIKTLEIRANDVDVRTKEGVRLATMHRVKGLEFQYVFIVGCDDRSIPLVKYNSNDPVELREYETIERALLHVAMTRAIRSLTITCHGKLTHFLNL
jgi:superfamily I DNA/RNA helicase